MLDCGSWNGGGGITTRNVSGPVPWQSCQLRENLFLLLQVLQEECNLCLGKNPSYHVAPMRVHQFGTSLMPAELSQESWTKGHFLSCLRPAALPLHSTEAPSSGL
jgi:hypothetical protein